MTAKMPAKEELGLSIAEELWFGDYPDDEAERAAAASMVAMTAKVLGLRPFPALAEKILRASRDPGTEMAKLSRLIEGDPSFAARTLRLVNSAALATRTPCKSIQQAVLRVGMQTIGEMAIAAATMEMFDASDETATGLRAHALIVAAVARQLAIEIGVPADDVYTCGLLHDLGKLLLLQYSEADGYAELLAANDESDALHVAERESFGYDHAVLGAHVLRGWNIPEPVPAVVAWHHQLARAVDSDIERARLVAVVRLANVIAHGLTAGELTLLARLARSPEAELLQISERQLANMWNNLQAAARESLTGDDVLAGRSEFFQGLCCETCQEAAVPCTVCLRAFCPKHGDSRAQRCQECAEAAELAPAAVRDAEAVAPVELKGSAQRTTIVALAVGGTLALGVLLYLLL